jgi:hypothetical protein
MSFLWYDTDNVRVCITSIRDPLDIEIYILYVNFGHCCHFGVLGLFCHCFVIFRHFY